MALETGSTPVNSICDFLDSIFSSIVSTLQTAANIFVPKCRKGFFKYWWDEEMHVLQDAAIESNKIWITAGKPKHGPIFHKRQSCRSQYRKRLREGERLATETYRPTNNLHEAPMLKNNTAFWKCWRSKFERSNKCSQVDGSVDPEVITNKFADHFRASITCHNPDKAELLKQSYLDLRATYCGLPAIRTPIK